MITSNAKTMTRQSKMAVFVSSVRGSWRAPTTVLTMAASATVRDLRNHFPKVKKLVEEQGEVVVTEQGAAKYRLVLHTPALQKGAPRRKDYMARLRRYQRRPLSRAEATALDEANRGAR